MAQGLELISKYFDLTAEQEKLFSKLPALYSEWNEKINVVSRKDIEQLMERHVLHSLAIAKFFTFSDGMQILDVGTGGGFPGIPLSIMFPKVRFTLVDSIGKKITVVKEVSSALGLNNVSAFHSRAENIEGKFDFVVSRAVAPFPEVLGWIRQKVKKGKENGLICLKGGDLTEELKEYGSRIVVRDISSVFEEEFFETKKVVYLPCFS